jgi:hypothetical protein
VSDLQTWLTVPCYILLPRSDWERPSQGTKRLIYNIPSDTPSALITLSKGASTWTEREAWAGRNEVRGKKTPSVVSAEGEASPKETTQSQEAKSIAMRASAGNSGGEDATTPIGWMIRPSGYPMPKGIEEPSGAERG